MGGFRIPLDFLGDMISLDNMDRSPRRIIERNANIPIMITPRVMFELARQGHCIYLANTKISDKSKANILQKALVLFQVTWMAIQCTTRRVYGLPLTLLEIHTMVHVLCAMALYAFWFKVSS